MLKPQHKRLIRALLVTAAISVAALYAFNARAQIVFDESQIPVITNSKAADMTGWTIKARNNAATGDPEDKKVSELTDEPSPASGDLLLAEDGATGELRKVDVTNLPYSVAESTTVSDTAEVDLTLTGVDITGAIVAGSIDETKLDASTNASLDLADTSTQPADNISTLTNDSGFISGITHAATTGQTASDHHAKAVSGDIDHDATVNFAAGEHFTQAAISITESQVSDLNHTMEGTAVLSTGETDGKKYLREDGDNSSSWQRITQITNDFEPESTITGSGTGFNLQFGAGDALYLNGSAGTSGQFIKTNGAGSAPTFATVTSESTTVSDTATIDLTLTGVDVSGIVVANSITTAELSDAADVPLVGEFVQVATGGLNVQYRTDAEVRADLDLEIGTDIDAAGTDNSTDVTLAGTGTYVTAVGQVLTVDPIDISTDTNLTGDAEIVLTGDALSIASTIARDTELHGNGTNCSAGNYPLGVDASGNAESCTSAAGGGDVTKVGTPVNDQIGIWTGDGTIEGVPGLRYGSDALSVGAGTSYSGKIGVYSDAALWLIHAQMSTDSTQSATIGAIKSRGTASAPTAVLSGDDLGQFASRGYDGTSWITGSQMLSSTTEAWSVGNNGTKTVFKTTPNGSATRTTALTLDQDQSATFENDVSIPNGDLSVTGDIVMPEKADHSGTPAAGNGYLWTKNDAPSVPVFTNDLGEDGKLGVVRQAYGDYDSADYSTTSTSLVLVMAERTIVPTSATSSLMITVTGDVRIVGASSVDDMRARLLLSYRNGSDALTGFGASSYIGHINITPYSAAPTLYNAPSLIGYMSSAYRNSSGNWVVGMLGEVDYTNNTLQTYWSQFTFTEVN